MRRVVVTGIGVAAPIGVGGKAFWSNLLAGQSGIKRTTRFDPAGMPCQISGEVPEYKIGDFVPKSYRKATKVMARDTELAVIAADDAFKDAGIQSKAYTDSPSIDGKRFGCNIGSGLISADLDELTAALHTARDGNVLDLNKWGREGMGHLTPLWLLKYLPNMPACHVTIIHGLMGPSNTITCAESSSHLAIGEAFRTIQRGKADLAICGGAESRINPMGMMRQSLQHRLNITSNDAPGDGLRPFDPEARGTVFGEGGGLLILEDVDHAKSRGAKIYAELLGFAASQDAYKITGPDPTGRSYAKAIENALKDAKKSVGDVDLLVPNGLGLAPSDRAELNGMQKAFGADLSRVPISAIKAQIGCLGAGCGVDAAAAALAVHHHQIPPSRNTPQGVDGQKLNASAESRDAKVNIAVTSVYSMGGQNAVLVFGAV